MLTLTTKKRLCPFLLEPFDNCYCVRMDSQDIERAINLCSNSFALCEIYRNKNGKSKGNGKQKILINLDVTTTE
jgi:hypothetical protein